MWFSLKVESHRETQIGWLLMKIKNIGHLVCKSKWVEVETNPITSKHHIDNVRQFSGEKTCLLHTNWVQLIRIQQINGCKNTL
jgi:hypothetical protein